MNKHKQSPGCYATLRRESFLRATLCGAAVGFGLGFLAAAVIWFTQAPGIWVPIAAALAGTAIASPLFWFRRFRPTASSDAQRIDSCGLEERAITMVEFAGDPSYLAQRQREDAAQKIAELDASRSLRVKIPRAVAVVSGICVALGLCMTTLTGLSLAGILPDGKSWIDGVLPQPDPVYVEVTYMVSEGGSIEGDEVQLILQGSDTTDVIAVPDEGYAFFGWDDGGKRPTRQEKNVQEDLVLTAIFAPVGDDGASGADGDQGDKVGDGDQPGDKPGGEDGQSSVPSKTPGGAGGQYQDCNQVIDGKTYYGSIYDEYYDAIQASLMENGELSSDLKSFIDNYFKIIQASDPDETEG